MSLKLIPLESGSHEGLHTKQKNFNPGRKIKKKLSTKDGIFKKICLQLIHFVNRGSTSTYAQIDELILSLHQLILNLQKKKHALLQEKSLRLRKKPERQ